VIAGGTSLADWRKGGDLTRIDGGALSANTVDANKLTIGNRALTLTGIQFEHNSPSPNSVSWTAGAVRYIDDAGATAAVSITAGNAAWSTGVLYVYWVKGATTLSTTTAQSTAFGANNVVLATYQGDTLLDADYGRTIIDGAGIKTRTITASQLITTAALITEEAQIGNAVITNAKIGNIIQSTNYVAGSAGWRINKDGTAQFQNLVVRDWLQVGAVTDTYQVIASANYAAPNVLTVRATLDLGATNRGDIYKRGLVFEARAPTSGVNVRVLLQRRYKTLGAGSFTAWETVETIIVDSSLHSDWTMFADSSTLCGYYDDFEYRVATEAYQSVAPYNPSSAYDATAVIRQIYLTLALVTR
jgi:hypothetical protein